jgi:uncharacterized protein YidB (DUF937 family)
MGQFDDAVKESVPGGDLVKPLMIAAGALLLKHFFSGKKEEPAPVLPAPGEQAPAQGGGLLGGLGDIFGSAGGAATAGGLGGLLANAASSGALSNGLNSLVETFRKAGQGPVIDTWVGKGENAPIAPTQINQTLGNDTIAEIAAKAGLTPEQMSQLLAQALPNLINKLTPEGKIPQA